MPLLLLLDSHVGDEQFAFTFPESVAYVRLPGGALKTIEILSATGTERVPVPLEDGSVAYFNDRLSIDAVLVEDDLLAVLDAPGPFDVFVKWTNADDGRLASASVVGAVMESTGRRPGDGGVETATFIFTAKGLM